MLSRHREKVTRTLMRPSYKLLSFFLCYDYTLMAEIIISERLQLANPLRVPAATCTRSDGLAITLDRGTKGHGRNVSVTIPLIHACEN